MRNMGSNNEYGGLRRVSDRLRESAKSLTDVVPLLRGSVVRRCAVSLASAAVLLSGCGKEPSEAYGSVGGNADGAIEVGFRPGTLTIAGSASDGAGWNTRSARRGAAASYPGMATRADLPPTGMVEGAFQIGDLWVDGNRGTATEKGMTWAEAMTYCQELGLRLPTEDEALNEIIPYVRANDPLPDSRKFVWRDGSYDEYYYWTSTPRSADANYVWSYYMHSAHTGVLGSMEGRDASYDAAPRCVKRDGELPPAPDSGPEVENPDGLPAGTTFRVLVYNAGDDPQEATPVAQNTYKVADAQGTIVATAVDERGNATEGEAHEIILRRGAYDFYYFSPAVAANTALPNPGMYTDLTNGSDYMALAHREVIDPSQGPKHYIPEVCFYRMGSYIDVRISPREGEILGTLEVSGEGLQLWGLPKSGFYEVGQYPYRLSVEGQGGMVEFAPEAFASEAGSTATVSTVGVRGGRSVLPGYANELTVRVTLTSDGKEMKLSSTLSGYVFEPGYRYVVELGVGRITDRPELGIEILTWNEYAWGDGEIGGGYLESATVMPAGAIPYNGGAYSVTLNGTLPSEGVEVRASSGGTVLATGKVTESGTAVSLNVSANTSYSSRTVSFEYKWNGTWTKIGDRTQAGYTVTNATHNAPTTIPRAGATYSVTLTGTLPSGGVEVRATSGGTLLATGKVTASGTAVSLNVPANTSYSSRTVSFEYKWNGTWTKIGDRTQAGYTVTNATHNAPTTIPRAGATYSVTLTGTLPSGGVEVRASSGGTALATGTVTVSGTAVSLEVPAHRSYDSRTVSFEYKWNGTWTKIGTDRTQAGYNITKASHNAPATISLEGGTYTITLTGWGEYKTRIVSGTTVLATNDDESYDPSKNYVTRRLTVPTGALSKRTISLQYMTKAGWTTIASTVTQQGKFLITSNSSTYDGCPSTCSSEYGYKFIPVFENEITAALDAYFNNQLITMWTGNDMKAAGYDTNYHQIGIKWGTGAFELGARENGDSYRCLCAHSSVR